MPAAAVQPVRVSATLDPRLSRWKWLVKWVLLIPHYVALAFLWLGFVLLSAAAFFAILVTGRYPRSIFEFNVGVLRWTWRVQYYAYAALGTDRYPPFTLADVADYPAHLEVVYPQRLSRRLVLVKSWLLAIPHYAVVAIFVGGGAWTLWRASAHGGDSSGWTGFGLIELLVLIAAIALAATGRYPQKIYDFVLGMNRWVLRVAAYAALMTDVYPPFRLDAGGTEPGGTLSLDETRSPDETLTLDETLTPGGTRSPGGAADARPGASASVLPRAGWTALRVVSVVVGTALVLVSLGLFAGGALALAADRNARDDGYVTSAEHRLTTTGYAITTSQLDLGVPVLDAGRQTDLLGTVRVRARSANPGKPLFIGIAPAAAADRYLTGVAHRTVAGVSGDQATARESAGHPPAVAPYDAEIWTVTATGSGPQTLVWPVRGGAWTLVVANADGSAGVDARADVGATVPGLGWVAAGLLAGGVVVAVLSAVLVGMPVRRTSRRTRHAVTTRSPGDDPPDGADAVA